MGQFGSMGYILLMFGVMYIFMIMPQQKEQKKKKNLKQD